MHSGRPSSSIRTSILSVMWPPRPYFARPLTARCSVDLCRFMPPYNVRLQNIGAVAMVSILHPGRGHPPRARGCLREVPRVSRLLYLPQPRLSRRLRLQRQPRFYRGCRGGERGHRRALVHAQETGTPVRAYEHALNELLTRLDAVAGNSDTAVRGRWKENTAVHQAGAIVRMHTCARTRAARRRDGLVISVQGEHTL